MSQGGNRLAFELRREPSTGIQGPQLVQSLIHHGTRTAGGAVQGVVMDNDDVAIGGKMHVELYVVHTQRQHLVEGGKGVFRRVGRRSPMGNINKIARRH